MIFYFSCSIVSQSILRLSLNHFIDEISCLDWPSTRDIALLYLNLLWKNVVSDFFSWFTNIWSSSKHALVCHHAYSKVVDASSVIDSAHYLGSHVTGCSWSILSVFRSPYSCNTKVSNSKVASLVDDQVFWLDISVNDILFVANLESCYQTCDPKLYKTVLI